jgi:hypothetical protein
MTRPSKMHEPLQAGFDEVLSATSLDKEHSYPKGRATFVIIFVKSSRANSWLV